MQIESGTTAWWRNRHLMFMAIFLGAGAWFAYDGYIKWPADNREWAAQASGAPVDGFQFNSRVSRDAINRFHQEFQNRGATVDDLRARFGDPTLTHEKDIWFIGPDAYLKVVLTPEGAKMDLGAATHRVTDMHLQRGLAIALAVVSLLIAIKLVRVITTRIVLDENGLRYNSRQISWEEMTGLRGEDYARRGWVHLEYAQGGNRRSFRLDSYHIAKFDELVAALCERKGFASPLAAEPDESAEGGPESSVSKS